MLRGIFGVKMEEGTGEGKTNNDKIIDLYSSPNIVRVFK